MARPIDEKIVRMTLDNANFKDRVKDTLQSFNAINDATKDAGTMDLSGIAKGIASIEKRFSATGVMIASVIKSITDSAISMGKSLYQATVGSLIEGGKKRALNIEQAKFQFAGLGMDVEKTMASANEAVLGTAFGLDEAAVVASQFGATGMRAGKEMTEALRGISGVAAMTGSSYSDIGSIFTTVAGNGRLMGNDLLRLGSRGVNAAATLAKAMNISEEEVRKMVTAGKISFEDFAGAMSDAFGEHATRANETYAGSLSNLRAALSRIGASIYTPRYEQLRNLFNSMTPVVDALNKAIQPLIGAFNDLSGQSISSLITMIDKIDFTKFVELGGITNIVSGFWNIVTIGRTILQSVSQAFKTVFPSSFLTTLLSITAGFEKLTAKLLISNKSASKITTIFTGVFAIFSTVFEIAKVLAKAIFGIIPEGTGGGVLDFLVIIAEMSIAFNESVKEGNFLTETIKGIGKVLGAVGQWLKTPIKHLIGFGAAIRDNIGPAIEWLGNLLAPVANWFREAFAGFGMNEILGGGFLVAVGLFLKKLSDFFDNATDSLDGITGAVKGVFSELGGTLKAFQDQVKYKNLMLIAVSIGILALSLKLLEGISIGDIAKGIGALVGSMAILAGGMMVIEKMSITGGVRASITIIAMSTAILIMAGALKKISDLNPKELITGLAGLVGIVTALSIAIIAISKFGGKIGVSSLGLIALATSVVILASAVKTMSSIDTKDLFKAVVALGVIFAELALFLIIVKGSKIGPGTALGLIGVAAAIKIIVGSINEIAKIDTPGLVKGLATIGIILLELALFSKIAGGPQLLAAGIGISLISVALNGLMGPITTMSKMSWEQLAKGLGGMAVALVAVGLAGLAASGSLAGAAGVMLMAVALNTLMPPILTFSKMSWGSMLKGIGGMVLGLAALAGVSLLLAPASLPMLGFGAAILFMGVAVAAVGAGIALFGVGLVTLASLTATSIAAIISALSLLIKGLGTLIVDIIVFVVDFGTALIGGLEELIPPLIEVTIKIIKAFVGGLIDYLAEMGPRAAEAFVKTIITILEIIGNHSQSFVEAGYDIVINILAGIEEKVPLLQEAALSTILAVINGMADALENNGQDIVGAVVRLMGEVILVVVEAGVQMVQALFGWIPGVKEATADIGSTAEKYIRDNFGAHGVGVDKGEEFSSGMMSTKNTISKTGEEIANYGMKGAGSVNLNNTGVKLGSQLDTGFNSKYKDLRNSGVKVADAGKSGAASIDLTNTGSQLGTELSKGLDSKYSTLRTSGSKVADAGKSGAASISLTSTGSDLGNGLATGVSSKSNNVRTAGKGIANSGKSGAASVSLRNTGSNFGNSFAGGMETSRSSITRKAKSLATAASNAVRNWLQIASPSKLTTGFGRFFGEGFGGGISDRVKYVGSQAKNMAVKATNTLIEYLGEVNPEEEEIKLKIVVDDDFDWDGLGGPIPVGVVPDLRYTNNLASSADNTIRQNRNKEPIDSGKINNDDRELLEVTKEQNKLLRIIASKETSFKINKKDMTDVVNEENALEELGLFF